MDILEIVSGVASGAFIFDFAFTKFFKRRHDPSRKPDRPIEYYLISGFGALHRGLLEANREKIEEGMDRFKEARGQYSDSGADTGISPVINYGLAFGYALLGEQNASSECVEKINGTLQTFREIQKVKEFLKRVQPISPGTLKPPKRFRK